MGASSYRRIIFKSPKSERPWVESMEAQKSRCATASWGVDKSRLFPQVSLHSRGDAHAMLRRMQGRFCSGPNCKVRHVPTKIGDPIELCIDFPCLSS